MGLNLTMCFNPTKGWAQYPPGEKQGEVNMRKEGEIRIDVSSIFPLFSIMAKAVRNPKNLKLAQMNNIDNKRQFYQNVLRVHSL